MIIEPSVPALRRVEVSTTLALQRLPWNLRARASVLESTCTDEAAVPGYRFGLNSLPPSEVKTE
jgi:hypothetical protein